MSESATTPEAMAETTSSEASVGSTGTAETATGQENPPASSEERSADSSASSEDDFKVEYNLDEVPREFRPHVEKLAKKYEKDFKSAFTRKSQERSEQVKAAQVSAERMKLELQQVYSEIQDALKNPEKLDAYRKLILKEQNQHLDAKKIPENITTVEQLLEYNEKVLQEKLSSMQNQIVSSTRAQLSHEEMTRRWDTALNNFKISDPKFKKYERFVANLIQTDPKYKTSYNGMNENEVLKQAYTDFKALLREDMEEVRDKTQKELSKKASQTTLTPSRAVATSSGNASASPEETLSRIRSRLAAMSL